MRLRAIKQKTGKLEQIALKGSFSHIAGIIEALQRIS